MKKYEILSLSLKIIGIGMLALYTLPGISALVMTFSSIAKGQFETVIFAFANITTFLIIPIILILLSDKISKKIYSKDEEPSAIGVSSKDIQSIAFSIVGILIIVLAIPKLASIIASHKILVNNYAARGIPMTESRLFLSMIGDLLRLLLGISLFIGSKTLTNLWHKLRS